MSELVNPLENSSKCFKKEIGGGGGGGGGKKLGSVGFPEKLNFILGLNFMKINAMHQP